MNNIYTLCPEVEASLEEARLRLRKVAANPDFITSIVKDACFDDYARLCPKYGGRRSPIVLHDKAINLVSDPKINSADIVLIDSATFANSSIIDDSWLSCNIQAKSFRPYLPYKGKKSDRSLAKRIKKTLYGHPENTDEVVEKIQSTSIKGGMYVKSYPQEFNMWAPKICLVYSISPKARRVFMLRPSAGNLNNITYRTYCYVVMSSFLKRTGGLCDLAFWDDMDEKGRELFHKSMWIPDQRLVTNEDEVEDCMVLSIPAYLPEIFSPDLLLAA